MKLKSFLLLLSIFLFSALFLQPVQAQFTGGYPSFTNLRPWVQLMVGNNQFPDSWLVFPNIIYYLVLPFISIFAVIYGIISDLRIFRHSRWVRGVIAVAMAGMTLPSGWLIQFVLYFYSFNAAFAAIMFGILFFVGVILWFAGTTGRMWFGAVSEINVERARNSEISSIRRQIQELETQNINDMSANDVNAATRRQNRDAEIRILNARERELKNN